MKSVKQLTPPLLNSRGQVALFVALIFQVLFVFFAMIVNVGLLVHHKINLQNSVDLAAYYGAMKQAEMLNAIGHVNYQIRQSWKLINFRYNQLGFAGAIRDTPYDPQGAGGAGLFRSEDDTASAKNFGFCIAYRPVNIVNATESYCQDAAGITVNVPGVPNIVSGFGSIFFGFQAAIAATANAMKNQAIQGCKSSMAVNWMQLANFIQNYKMDIRNRKKLLLGLANKLSADKPTDVDGDSIKKGVYQTLKKNLTIQSQESLSGYSTEGEGPGSSTASFKYYNSLSSSDCGPIGNELEPPKWMSEMFVFPIYVAIDAQCSGNSVIQFEQKYFNTGSIVASTSNVNEIYVGGGKITQAQLDSIRENISEIGSSDPKVKLFRTSLGFEKNPWCVAYTGVSASVTPKIPFSPLGDVTLTAKAFAKPFGGRIGPWYSRVWPQNAPASDMSAVLNQNQLVDGLLPIRVQPDTAITNFDPGTFATQKRLFPNHSRYMGDVAGIASQMTMGQFEKGIHSQTSINLNWYTHTFSEDFDAPNSGSGDVLAFDKDMNTAPPLRNIEIAAVAPDQFDIANYSIDPDFYNNYLTRIQKGYQSQFQFMLRGDLGSRMQGTDPEKRFSIRNQIEVNRDSTKAFIDTTTKLTYFLNKIGQVLTSWQQRTPDSYVIDTDRFGKCGSQADDDKLIKQDAQEKEFASGSCKAGGRTGYSVKLVDGKFLKNEVNGKTQSYELGGKGVTGQIKNPPPDNF